MRILFVEKKLKADKLGILYLAGVLKKAGHIVDMVQDDIDSAEEYMNKNKVDYVMYSVMTGDHSWHIEKNKELKKKFNFKSVVGGPHYTFFPEEAESNSDIDHCVIGPGEEVIVDLVEGRLNQKIIKGHLCKDVQALLPPDREMLYKYDEFGKAGMKRFIAGRDCPYACSYCYNHLLHKIYSDEKSSFFQITNPKKIIDEVIDVKNKYGLEIAFFNDDDFSKNREWLFEFCDLFKKNVGIKFIINIRSSNVDEKVLQTLYDSGCIFISLALESANVNTQRILKRSNFSNDKFIEVCNLCNKIGIKYRVLNMIGLPVDDPLKDALETLEFNQKISPTDSLVNIFQPVRKTDIWKYCIDKGLLDSDTEIKPFNEGTILKIKDPEKISRLEKWWSMAVDYKIPIPFIKILLEQEIDKKVGEKMQNLRFKNNALNFYNLII